MGTVYLAEDPVLKRGIAIKVVRGSLGDQAVLARFRREAEISARLNHPNIITIFDVGEEPDQGPFLAMEFIDGEGLDDAMKAGPLEPEAAMSLLIQAAHALDAIHQAGVVHRDVKPSNFMVTKDGRLKLMDFGIARMHESKLTSTAEFLGTPSYASPESLSGMGKSDESSDLWGFSVTAFEALTGRLPFEAESVNAVLYRVAHEPPHFPEGLDPSLKGIFEQAFHKDPSRRFPSLAAFVRALTEVLPLAPTTYSTLLSQLDAPLASSGFFRARQRTPKTPKLLWMVAPLALLLGLAGWIYWNQVWNTRVIAIYSNPSGANVLLNGVALGHTPLPKVVLRGHEGKLRMEKQDFETLDHELGPEEQRLDLTLVPKPFTVNVITEPVAGEVFLDGKSMGDAPRKILVPGEGRHQLEVRADGYEAWSTVLSRHEELPTPIRLHKHAAPRLKEKDSKVKRFLKNLLEK